MRLQETVALSLCAGVNRQYHVRVRYEGWRKYRIVGKPTRSYRAALRRLADEFATGRYKRGDVLLTADYYDPIQVCEIVR